MPIELATMQDPLDIILGDATPLQARVYVRLPLDAYAHGTIDGTVSGPKCTTSRMLPADFVIRDCGDGPTKLGEATIPDPCYWSLDVPALYDVQVNWRVGTEIRASWRRTIGLKRFGTRSRSWYFNGERWVLRGVSRSNDSDTPWSEWRAASAVCVCESISEEAGKQASAAGVPLVAWLGRAMDEQPSRLVEVRRLARIPAVLAVIVPWPWPKSEDVEECRRAGIGIWWIAETQTGSESPRWADALLVHAEQAMSADAIPDARSLPIVAFRPLTTSGSIERARAACDELQRDLAPRGDFAGYVV